jgi:prevent-host-death family protein
MRMTMTDARAALPQVLDRVAAGEEIVLTRHGEVVAVIVRPDVLRVRRASEALEAAAEVLAVLEKARESPPGESSGLSPERAEALVAAVQADRSAG